VKDSYFDSHIVRPAAAPEAQAHWKLKPPRWPVTSTTSPIKKRPGTLRDSMVLLERRVIGNVEARTSILLQVQLVFRRETAENFDRLDQTELETQ
jgi:hypothetical protein